MARLTVQEIRDLVIKSLKNAGVSAHTSEIVADVTCAAELRGVSSHGVKMVPVYLHRLKSGGININATPSIKQSGDNMYIVDGDGGFGQEAASLAADLISEGTKNNSAIVAAIKNTNHCGMLAYYTNRISTEFSVGFMTSNTNPNVAAFGGAERVLGTNPFSIAFPNKEENIIIDMATTSIAKGKIYEYQTKGIPLPEGVALTSDGEKTTDPKAAIEGILLPFAGYKGYAISLAVEILSGIITGAGYSKYAYSLHSAPDRQQNVGQLMAGIPIAAFLPKDEYFRRIEDFSDIVKNGRKEKTSTGIYFPGDLENIKQKDHLANGIEIDEEIIKQL